jgi:hypothetical protein
MWCLVFIAPVLVWNTQRIQPPDDWYYALSDCNHQSLNYSRVWWADQTTDAKDTIASRIIPVWGWYNDSQAATYCRSSLASVHYTDAYLTCVNAPIGEAWWKSIGWNLTQVINATTTAGDPNDSFTWSSMQSWLNHWSEDSVAIWTVIVLLLASLVSLLLVLVPTCRRCQHHQRQTANDKWQDIDDIWTEMLHVIDHPSMEAPPSGLSSSSSSSSSTETTATTTNPPPPSVEPIRVDEPLISTTSSVLALVPITPSSPLSDELTYHSSIVWLGVDPPQDL